MMTGIQVLWMINSCCACDPDWFSIALSSAYEGHEGDEALEAQLRTLGNSWAPPQDPESLLGTPPKCFVDPWILSSCNTPKTSTVSTPIKTNHS